MNDADGEGFGAEHGFAEEDEAVVKIFGTSVRFAGLV